MPRELSWQWEVKGEQGQITLFMEQVLSLQDFRAFAFMKPGSPWLHIGHGFRKFFSLACTVPELEGKVVMFVGDRGSVGTQWQCCLCSLPDRGRGGFVVSGSGGPCVYQREGAICSGKANGLA